jgi:hypothetical protein
VRTSNPTNFLPSVFISPSIYVYVYYSLVRLTEIQTTSYRFK